jgi:hypothetical protein
MKTRRLTGPGLSPLLGLLSALLVLTACASGAASQSSSAGDALPAQAQELSTPLQLAAGTLMLETTSQAVQSQQAAELLPLWQAYRTLSSSSTAAQVEVDAVLDQIEDAMTPEQLQAIAEMDLSSLNMSELFQELGIEGGSGRELALQGTPDPDMLATVEAGGGFQGGRGGEFPAGEGIPGSVMGPGGGLGQGGGILGTPNPKLMATRQALAGGFTGGGRVNTALFQALIDLLESKAAS